MESQKADCSHLPEGYLPLNKEENMKKFAKLFETDLGQILVFKDASENTIEITFDTQSPDFSTSCIKFTFETDEHDIKLGLDVKDYEGVPIRVDDFKKNTVYIDELNDDDWQEQIRLMKEKLDKANQKLIDIQDQDKAP